MSNVPEGAQLSEDRQWYWDGAAWQAVASASASTAGTPSPWTGSTHSFRFERSQYDWYAQHGAWWTGYGAGQLEVAGGDCMAVPAGDEGWEYDDGYAWGKAEAMVGVTRDPRDPNALPDSARQRMVEEAQKEQERLEYSRSHQEVMYEDGTVETQEQHEAREIRERLEGMNPEMPEPVELEVD